MKVTRIIAAVAMSTVLAGTAQAQATPFVNCVSAAKFAGNACAITNTVNAAVPYVARMELVLNTTLDAPTIADFGNANGKTTAAATVLNVRSNAGFTITASAANANWVAPAGTTKPASDLRILTDLITTPAALSAPQSIFSSASPTASTDVNIRYNVLYDWTRDIPGSYSLTVNYTLTSP